MNVYLAGAYGAREHLLQVAGTFVFHGHTVTSSWLLDNHPVHTGTINTAPDQYDSYCVERVRKDLADILRSDVLVAYSRAALTALDPYIPTASGGRHVETGFAISAGIPVIVVGEPDNIFHRALCTIVPDLSTTLTTIEELQDA